MVIPYLVNYTKINLKKVKRKVKKEVENLY